MSWGKIEVGTNYLVTSQINVDGTFRPLTDFVKDSNGEYYTYYINTSTPDSIKNDIEKQSISIQDTNVLVSNITVNYTPIGQATSYVFSGSEEAQFKIVKAMQMLEGKPDTKTSNIFDVNHKLHKLVRDDFDNLLDAIEPIYESITDD